MAITTSRGATRRANKLLAESKAAGKWGQELEQQRDFLGAQQCYNSEMTLYLAAKGWQAQADKLRETEKEARERNTDKNILTP
jgi:hypothetical protein